MYRSESRTVKKAKCWRIDASEVWWWWRLSRVPWTARRSNKSILKETNPEYSLEGLKLKLQYFGHRIQRANSLEKTLMLEKTEGKRWKEQQRMKWLDSITNSMDMNLSTFRETVGDRRASCIAVHEFAKTWTQLSDSATRALIPNVWVCHGLSP